MLMTPAIHVIWIGEIMPKDIEENIESWRKKYGRNRIKIWNEKNLSKVMPNFHEYSQFHPAKIADIARVHILEKFGGWYIDADTKPGNLQLPTLDKNILFFENNRSVMNGVMFSVIESNFMLTCQKEILKSLNENHKDIAYQTGPMAITRALHTFNVFNNDEYRANISIYPRKNIRIKSKNRTNLSRRYFAVDLQMSSWNKMTQSKIKWNELIYYSFLNRRTAIYCYELLRFVILKNKLGIYLSCKCNRKAFQSIQNSYLENWEELCSTFECVELDSEIVRNLSVVKIRMHDNRGISKLSKAGWYFCKKHNLFVRTSLKDLI